MSTHFTMWTLQPEVVWTTLQETGVFRADGRRVVNRWFQRDGSYQWMRDQFRERIPGGKGRTQIWAWLQPKPDLRRWAWRAEKGSTNYRIEFQIPIGKVLLSDFDLWHQILNNEYLALSKAEDDAFEAEEEALHKALMEQGLSKPEAWNKVREHFRSRVISTWPRVFDLDAMSKLLEDPWYGGEDYTPEDQMIQGVFEELRLEWVTQVTPYQGRCTW